MTIDTKHDCLLALAALSLRPQRALSAAELSFIEGETVECSDVVGQWKINTLTNNYALLELIEPETVKHYIICELSKLEKIVPEETSAWNWDNSRNRRGK